MKFLFVNIFLFFATVLAAQPVYKLNMPGAVERKMADRLADEVSVLDFGAVGDGKANDTKAFEKAIAAANGRAIGLQGRTYAINLLITQGQVRINGNGAKLLPVISGVPVITIKPQKYIHNIFISDLEINGVWKKSDGIYVTNNSDENGADFISLNNVEIKFCRYAFNVEGRSIWNKFSNCRMDWNVGGLRVKTGLACNLWDITASTFNANEKFGVWMENLAAATEGFKDIKFQSCNFENNGQGAGEAYGGYFDGLEMLVMDNMYVEGNGKKGEGYGVRITGLLGRGFSINGGWFGDCKYPIVIDGEKKWGSISNVKTDSKGYKSEGSIFIRSQWLNDEPKIVLTNCFGDVVSKVDSNGNSPLAGGVDWETFQPETISVQYREWLKIFTHTKDVYIRNINGLYNGKRFGLINYSQANYKLIIDAKLMYNDKPLVLGAGTSQEFIVDGYPAEGKLRPI